jgi:hypothetical protein
LGVPFQGTSGIGLTGSDALSFADQTFGINGAGTGINVSINNNGGGVAFNVCQPTLLLNQIMRII